MRISLNPVGTGIIRPLFDLSTLTMVTLQDKPKKTKIILLITLLDTGRGFPVVAWLRDWTVEPGFKPHIYCTTRNPKQW